MKVFLQTNYIKAAIIILILINNAKANDILANANDKYLYIGTELGLSEPIIKSFKHKDSNTLIRLKQSRMIGGMIGCSFYPNMMVEISGTHQPNYKLAYRLPEQSLASTFPGVSIPVTPGSTKVTSNVFLVNLIYEMQKMTAFEVKPYAIFGLGVATISIKPTISYWQTPDLLQSNPVNLPANLPYFKVKKNIHNCFVWQMGLGVSKDLLDNFSVDFGAKIQVVHDIKIKYQTFNLNTQAFEEATPIKKTIGVGEFTVGLTYKIPLNK